MSRYLLLSLIVLPIALYNILVALVDYKTRAITKKGSFLVILLWLAILIGIILSERIYIFLFSNNLTSTEPMSLFDVVALAATIILTNGFVKARAEINQLKKQNTEIIESTSKIYESKDTNTTI